MRNIYLIGMMGSGKTSSGKALAKALKMTFVDLDERIVARSGRSINAIFQTEGEPYFRNLERELLEEAACGQNQVVGTGGGAVLDPGNRSRMKASGLVVYLKTSVDVLWDRVKHAKHRPLLQAPDPRQALSELSAKRVPLYESIADKMFLTDGKSPQQVAQEIASGCIS